MSTATEITQQQAAAALADLLQKIPPGELPATTWLIPAPATGSLPTGLVQGVCGASDPAARIDAIDRWAEALGTVAHWERGAYFTVTERFGVAVCVLAPLPQPPAEIEEQTW